MSAEYCHVLVVGAGPVGLALACELRRYGVDCRIVDAADGPTPLHESRALVLQARTLEVLNHMDLAARLVDLGRPIHALNLYQRGCRVGHVELDFADLDTPYPFVLVLEQAHTERALIAKLKEFGKEVQWRTRLADFRQDARGVTATLCNSVGDSREVRCEWMAGCDGARSTVRQLLRLPFAGDPYETGILLADAEVSWPLEQDADQILLVRGKPMVAIPLPAPNRWRLIDPSEESSATGTDEIVDRFRSLLRDAGFHDAVIGRCLWTSAFRLHRRAADRMRVGRCFLVGDAAHIYSPVGGQGMNNGIQEAKNLGWKLGMVVSGTSPISLLDSYESERLRVAQRVERGTDIATRIAMWKHPAGLHLRNRLVPLLGRVRFVRRRVTSMMSELGVTYRASAISDEKWDSPATPTTLEPGDRVGDWPIALHENKLPAGSLCGLFKSGKYILLAFFGATTDVGKVRQLCDVGDEVLSRFGRSAMDAWLVTQSIRAPRAPAWSAGVILDPQLKLHARFGADGPCVFLLRPDGHVAFRCKPADASVISNYLNRILAFASRGA